MTTSLALLLAWFLALCVFGVFVAVLVVLIRAATRPSGRPTRDNGVDSGPPIMANDSLTYPANPMYLLHHPNFTADVPSRHHPAVFGASPSSIDSAPSSSPSVDGGSSSGSSSDSGSSSGGSDSGGSGCG